MKQFRMLLPLSALLFAACDSDDLPPAAPLIPSVANAQSSKGPSAFLRGGQLERYRIAEEVPGFAGLEINPDEGTVTVLISRDDARGPVVPHIVRILERRRESWGPEGRDVPLPSIRFRRVEHDYVQLAHWYERVLTIVGEPAITQWTLSEGRNRVVVRVMSAADIDRVRTLIADLGIPPNGFEVEVGGFLPQATLEDRFPVRVGGIRIWNSGIGCTLGVNTRTLSGVGSFLTASHCSGTPHGLDQSSYRQPTELIGYEIADIAGYPCDPWPYKCRLTDAALAKYDRGSFFKFIFYDWGSLASSGPGNTYDDGTIHITRGFYGEVSRGDYISRTGATSGRVKGQVIEPSTSGKSFLPGSPPVDLYTIILAAVEVAAPVKQGDSGGPAYYHLPLVVYGHSWAQFAGIVFGGDSTRFFFSRLPHIEADLQQPLGVVQVTVGISGPTTIKAPGYYEWRATDPSGSSRSAAPYFDFLWERSYDGQTWSQVGSNSEIYWENHIKVPGGCYGRYWLRVTAIGGEQYGQRGVSPTLVGQIGSGCLP